jgi:hypothetical protein
MTFPNREYSIYFGSRAADNEEIESISDITVEQVVDMIWEGKVSLTIGMNEKGTWSIEKKEFAYPQSRLRLEMKKDRSFIPLIDGPIVNIDTDMSSEPGQSNMTLTVYDDSILLDNDDEYLHFNGSSTGKKTDSEMAKEIYSKAIGDGILDCCEIMNTVSEPQIINFRGTRMQLLRKLARRNRMHAYVLPGRTPGKSIGCFKPYPEMQTGLADLVLSGEDKNIEGFKVNIDCLKPIKEKGCFLDSQGKNIQSFSQDYNAFGIHGDTDIIKNTKQISQEQVRAQLLVGPGVHMIHPNRSFGNDMEQQINAQAYESGFAIEASGQLTQSCRYSEILTPYNLINVRGINAPYCGQYVITNVSHKITKDSYGQSFTMIRDAFSNT